MIALNQYDKAKNYQTPVLILKKPFSLVQYKVNASQKENEITSGTSPSPETTRGSPNEEETP